MCLTSSKLKSTPPIGAPNATLTPAAEAADKICNMHDTGYEGTYSIFHNVYGMTTTYSLTGPGQSENTPKDQRLNLVANTWLE